MWRWRLGGRSGLGAEVEAIRDPNYFLKQIQRCEQNFSETMHFWNWKTRGDDVGPDFGFWVMIFERKHWYYFLLKWKGTLFGVRLGGSLNDSCKCIHLFKATFSGIRMSCFKEQTEGKEVWQQKRPTFQFSSLLVLCSYFLSRFLSAVFRGSKVCSDR